MRALTFVDIGRVEMADVPRPAVEDPTDVVVRVTTTAICGSDLHVLHGRIPGMIPGGILGHEFTGVVEEAGPGVRSVKPGDRVLASFTIPCGACWFCNRRLFSRCPDMRVFGYGMFLSDLNGGQAEYVRVPNADLCLRVIDASMTDEQVLFAGDIFTTGFDCAVEARIEQGDVVVVQGCGPVGLMAVQAARAFKPAVTYAVDTVAQRLEMAQGFGAVAVDAAAVHVPSHIQDHTDGRGGRPSRVRRVHPRAHQCHRHRPCRRAGQRHRSLLRAGDGVSPQPHIRQGDRPQVLRHRQHHRTLG
jgi:threonine dehydrogenase-like Zn-dependent dehydrogenase